MDVGSLGEHGDRAAPWVAGEVSEDLSAFRHVTHEGLQQGDAGG